MTPKIFRCWKSHNDKRKDETPPNKEKTLSQYFEDDYLECGVLIDDFYFVRFLGETLEEITVEAYNSELSRESVESARYDNVNDHWVLVGDNEDEITLKFFDILPAKPHQETKRTPVEHHKDLPDDLEVILYNEAVQESLK